MENIGNRFTAKARVLLLCAALITIALIFPVRAFASSYSLRDQGKLTAVQNQGSYGICWAFSATSAIESNQLIKYGTTEDYSELHLGYFAFNNTQADPLGGTAGDTITCLGLTSSPVGATNLHGALPPQAITALATWRGLVDEPTAPYSLAASANTGTAPVTDAYANVTAHLQNAYSIPLSDAATVKKLIQEVGGATVFFYADTSAYNATTHAWYNGTYNIFNHAVTLVGWDDDYSADNFGGSSGTDAKPTDNGAWLVKNSWGSSWGDGGYFWLSYEDASLTQQSPLVTSVMGVSTPQAYFYDAEPADNYDHNYQYDGGTSTTWYSVQSGSAAANVYTAASSQNVEAVSFFTNTTNANYSVSIYKNSTSSTDPISGTLVGSGSGTVEYAGYHTVKLDTVAELNSGDTFSAVVTFTTTDGSNIQIAGDTTTPNVSLSNYEAFITNTMSRTTQTSGQSFYKSGASGSSWYDMASSSSTMRIKAFTEDYVNATFNPNGGTLADGVSATERIKVGDDYGTLPTPTHDGYAFIGWYTAAEGGTQVTSTTAVTTTSDQTLYAHWAVILDTATLPVLTKTVSGTDTPSETFDFQMTAGQATYADGTTGTSPLPTSATGQAAYAAGETGSKAVSFGSIAFDQPGTYTYSIRETTQSGGGWTCDGAEHTLTVEVSYSDEDILVATFVPLRITNTYQAPAKETTVTTTVTSTSPAPDSTVAADDTITYSLTSTNTGSNTAAHVMVRDYIPAGTTYVPTSATGGGVFVAAADSATGVAYVEWAIDGLAVGTNVTHTFQVTVDKDIAADTTIENIAYTGQSTTVVTPGNPANPAPTIASSSVYHHTATESTSPIVQVVKTAQPNPGSTIAAGQQITYTLTVSNTGNADAEDIAIYDAVPANTTLVFVDAANNGTASTDSSYCTWVIPSLVADGSTTCTFTVRVNVGTASVTVISNQASYGSDVTAVPTSPLSKVTGIVEHMVDNPPIVFSPTVFDPPVTKVVTGDTPASVSTFTFTLTPGSDTTPMPDGKTGGTKTTTTTGAGTSEFGNIVFSAPGTYAYTIAENAGDSATGYTYDTTVYTLTVSVVADKDNKLVATGRVTKSDGTVVESAIFTNRYTTASTPVNPDDGGSDTPANPNSGNAVAPTVASTTTTVTTTTTTNSVSTPKSNTSRIPATGDVSAGSMYLFALVGMVAIATIVAALCRRRKDEEDVQTK